MRNYDLIVKTLADLGAKLTEPAKLTCKKGTPGEYEASKISFKNEAEGWSGQLWLTLTPKPVPAPKGEKVEWSAMPNGDVVAGKVEGAAHWFIGGEWKEAKVTTPPAPPKAPAPPAAPKAPTKKAVK